MRIADNERSARWILNLDTNQYDHYVSNKQFELRRFSILLISLLVSACWLFNPQLMWVLVKRDGTILKTLWEATFRGGWHRDYNAARGQDDWICEFDLDENCVHWISSTEQITLWEPEQQLERSWH